MLYICTNADMQQFLFYIHMSEIKNIKITEDFDCNLYFSNERLDRVTNKVFIDFITDKDNSVIYNEVVVNTDSNNTPQFIYKPDKDGLFTYYRIVIPTLDYFNAGNQSYIIPANSLVYDNESIYYTETEITELEQATKETSINIIYNKAKSIDSCYYGEKKYFCLCYLSKCLYNNILNSLKEFVANGCYSACKVKSVDKSDLSVIILSVLKYLLCEENQDYDEANRIYQIVNSCDGFLCHDDNNITYSYKECNCEKNT